LDTGARMLVDEIRAPRPSQVEVVYGGSPVLSVASEPRVWQGEIDITPDRYSFLTDHAVDGAPVVPMVWIIEWAARAAKSAGPDRVVTGCRDLRMLKGIRLTDPTRTLRVRLELRETAELDAFECSFFGAEGTPLYRCLVEVGDAHLAPPGDALTVSGLSPWPFSRDAAYTEHLFHGPAFQVIETLEGVSTEAASAVIEGGREFGSEAGVRQTDSGLLDGGLQLALLWTAQVLGRRNLPTGIEQYVVYAPGLSRGSIRCVLKGQADATGLQTRSDLLFVDDVSDAVLAELRGVEMHVIPDE
ncbi:MAG: polyketide synthase dehydratase domain-containing protein, partial [Leptospirales bacterium]